MGEEADRAGIEDIPRNPAIKAFTISLTLPRFMFR
jgi:hypothetical protein